MKNIRILDAEFKCLGCGQKLKLAHLKCTREKRLKLIAEIVEDLKLNSPMGGFKYTRNELIEKWEGRKK